MIDLSLVPVEDLIQEVQERCSEFVCAYYPNDFQKHKDLMFYYGKGSWHRSSSLANILNNDVLNNWNGEMKTLQRINNEGIL